MGQNNNLFLDKDHMICMLSKHYQARTLLHIRNPAGTSWCGREISLLELSIGWRSSSLGVSCPDREGWELCQLGAGQTH